MTQKIKAIVNNNNRKTCLERLIEKTLKGNSTYIIRLAITTFTSGKMTDENWNITRTNVLVETLTLKFPTILHKANNF